MLKQVGRHRRTVRGDELGKGEKSERETKKERKKERKTECETGLQRRDRR